MIDVSREITEDMVVYKNYDVKRPKYIERHNYDNSDFYESSVTLDLHTGTHIDAPLHMIRGGEDMRFLDLNKINREIFLIDLKEHDGQITEDVLKNYNINVGDFLLFKTRNSFTDEFELNFAGISPDGAKYLSKLKISGVGVDGLSVESNNKEHEAHKELMNNNIIIIEGLKLGKCEQGKYKMICLPIKILKYEAAPCRVVLEAI